MISEMIDCFFFFFFFLKFSDDVCASNPCQNGATCQLVVDGYICTCDSGFLGTHCEIGKKLLLFKQVSNYKWYHASDMC